MTRSWGSALKWLHTLPDEKWTVTRLARRVGASRSVLAERFKHLRDQPPMQYLAHWHLLIASQLHKTSDTHLKSVVARVGYESEPAFNRAFKRLFVAPPASWCKQQTAANPGPTREFPAIPSATPSGMSPARRSTRS